MGGLKYTHPIINNKNLNYKYTMALNCKISKPIPVTCDTTVSGINLMMITNWSADFTATASGTDCLVDTIDLGTEKFYEINVATDSATASAELSAGANKDAKAINHIVSGVFNRIDCDLISDFKNWLLGTVVIAFQTRNREVFLAGFDNGLTAEVFNYATGAVEGDQSGISFTFSGIQPSFFLKVKDWATIQALT